MQVSQLKCISSDPLNASNSRSKKRQEKEEDVDEKTEIRLRRLLLLTKLLGIELGKVIAHSIREYSSILGPDLGQKIRKTGGKTN
jgi:hypothetical protein